MFDVVLRWNLINSQIMKSVLAEELIFPYFPVQVNGLFDFSKFLYITKYV